MIIAQSHGFETVSVMLGLFLNCENLDNYQAGITVSHVLDTDMVVL